MHSQAQTINDLVERTNMFWNARLEYWYLCLSKAVVYYAWIIGAYVRIDGTWWYFEGGMHV